MPAASRTRNRRAFLKFLTGSPYAAALGGVSMAAFQARQSSDLISDPRDALDVLDFEEVAHRNVSAGHWAYMMSGVDDDATLKANREGFKYVQLRPRRLVDATRVNLRVEWWGSAYDSPIFLCPTGLEKSIHPDGELAVAQAAKSRGTLQVLSCATSTGLEDVNRALGRPAWFQLYAASSWAVPKNSYAAPKPRDPLSSPSLSTTRRAETAKPISASAPGIFAHARLVMKVSLVPRSKSGACMMASICGASGRTIWRWTGPLWTACASWFPSN